MKKPLPQDGLSTTGRLKGFPLQSMLVFIIVATIINIGGFTILFLEFLKIPGFHFVSLDYSTNNSFSSNLNTTPAILFFSIGSLLAIFALIIVWKNAHSYHKKVLRENVQILQASEKKAQTMLLQQEAILQNIPDLAWVKDSSGKIISVNLAFEKAFNLKQVDIAGKTNMDLWPEEMAEKYTYEDQWVVKNARQIRVLEDYKSPDGESRWVDTIKAPVFDADHIVIGTIGIARDITELKLKEDKIKHLNRIYSFLSEINKTIVRTQDQLTLFNEVCRIAVEYGNFEAACICEISSDSSRFNVIPTSSHIKNNQGLAQPSTKVNPRLNDQLLKSLVAGKSYVDNNATDTMGFYDTDENNTFSNPYSIGFFPILFQETPSFFLCLFSEIKDYFHAKDMDLLAELTSDISFSLDMLEREKQRIIAEERFRHVFENASLGMAMVAMDGKYLEVNKAFAAMLGYEEEELNKLSVQEITFPDDVNTSNLLLKDIGDSPAGSTRKLEKRYLRKNGEILWAEISCSVMPFLLSRSRFFITQILDITDRRKAVEEIKKLNQDLELRVAERTTELLAYTRELEAFSYSVSHDLSAPLRSIIGFSTALTEDYSNVIDSKGFDYINRINNAVSRMARLIEDLLSLSMITRQEAYFEEVNISSLVEDLLSTMVKDEKTTVTYAKNIIAFGDKGLIRIALENLLGNAIKYSAHETNPTVVLDTIVEDGLEYLRIKDNGVGFDMVYASKLFTPFQRLHSDSEFKGNGIGLALVQRIINKHGGEIRAMSNPGEGATFIFRFSSTKQPVIL